jgi:hypothetical protein
LTGLVGRETVRLDVELYAEKLGRQPGEIIGHGRLWVSTLSEVRARDHELFIPREDTLGPRMTTIIVEQLLDIDCQAMRRHIENRDLMHSQENDHGYA